MSRAFNFMATGVGSLPFRDLKAACELIFQHVPEAPHWPQLPRLSSREGMIDQFLEGMPGVVEAGTMKRAILMPSLSVANALKGSMPSWKK
jgi:hypothetical protein